MERVTQAAALVRGTEAVRVRGVIVEADALDDFRQYAARRLVAELDTLLSEPTSSTVARVRDAMVRDPASVQRAAVARTQWLSASGTRLRALRRLERESAGELAAAASTDLDAARASARRAVAASIGVLVLVAGFGLVLRRSITRPLEEVSEGARMLSAGQLGVRRDLRGPRRDRRGRGGVPRPARHDRAPGRRDPRDERGRQGQPARPPRRRRRPSRADGPSSWAGSTTRWPRSPSCRAGANRPSATPTASSSSPRICSASPGSTATSSASTPRSRACSATRPRRCCRGPLASSSTPMTARRATSVTRGARPDEDVRYEQRHVCSDGAVRRIEWSARFVPEERLVYGVGRDVTESRRAAEEQAALRRVATLVAKGVAPAEIFAAVAAGGAGAVRRRRGGRRAPRARWLDHRRRARCRTDPARRTSTSPPRSSRPAARPAPTARSAPRSSSRTACGASSPRWRAPSRCRPAPRSGSPASPTSSPRRSRTPKAARRSPRPARASSSAARRGAQAGRSRSPRRRAAGARAHDPHAGARVPRARRG